MLKYSNIGKLDKLFLGSSSTMINSNIYQTGGYLYNDDREIPVSSIKMMDTNSNIVFKECGNLPEELCNHAIVYTKNRLYVIGGKRLDGTVSSTVWSTKWDFTKAHHNDD